MSVEQKLMVQLATFDICVNILLLITSIEEESLQMTETHFPVFLPHYTPSRYCLFHYGRTTRPAAIQSPITEGSPRSD
jgi:hypothetical protein